MKNNLKNRKEKTIYILITKYVIIIEVYCIRKDIIFVCGYCILLLDVQLF
jgi:hypothetical protein